MTAITDAMIWLRHIEGVGLGIWTQDERFLLMFGTSEADLTAQGVDVETYVRKHSGEAMDRVYQSFVDKRARGDSLLPYWAPMAWISTGRTKLSTGGSGSLEFDSTRFLLERGGKVLLDWTPSKLQRRPVALWLGLGFRLDAGDQGRWFVQPRYSYSLRAMKRARRAMPVFADALVEAGVH